MTARLFIVALLVLLGGCVDELTKFLADPRVAQREADAKAIGGACRFGLRSIEDCYTLNEKASKSAMFTGWKEMDVYMRENKVDGIPAKIERPPPPPPAPKVSAPIEEDMLVEEEPKTKGKSKVKASGH